VSSYSKVGGAEPNSKNKLLKPNSSILIGINVQRHELVNLF
jgi:hypothetical protein